MHRLTVQYYDPSDPDEFDRDYQARHVHLVHTLPGLARFTTSKPHAMGPGQVPYLVAELDFLDADSLRTCLRSDEMARTAADAQTFEVASLVMFAGDVHEPTM